MRRRRAGARQGEKGKKRRKDTLAGVSALVNRWYKEANKQAEFYGELADLVDAAAQANGATEPTEQIPYSEEKTFLPELAELYQQNGDMVGWISIADTNINYPVMQSANEPNFYLKHGFDEEYSDYGCPYT